MTLAQWADLSTIVASLVAMATLGFIAWQAWGISVQAKGIGASAEGIRSQTQEIAKQTLISLEQLNQFTRRAQVDLAYDMISKYADPVYLEHFRGAIKVLNDKTVAPLKKAEMMTDLDDPFSVHFYILGSYMENLANLYAANHIDRVLVKQSLFTPVWQYYKRADQSGLIEEIRKKQPSAFKLWQDLAEEWEKEARPK